MATFRVNNATVIGGEVCSQWQADHAYAEGARCVCTTAYGTVAARAKVFECTTAGTSHSSEPAWDLTDTNTTNDNAAVWTCRNPNDGAWNNASCHLPYITNHAMAAGDTVLVDDGHAETTAYFYIIQGAQSNTAPIKIICVDKADDSLSVGATFASTKGWNYAITFNHHGYSYGVTYIQAGAGIVIYREATNYVSFWLFEMDSPSTNVFQLSRSVAGPGIQVTGYYLANYNRVVLMIRNAGISLSDYRGYFDADYSEIIWQNGVLTAAAEITKLFYTPTFCNILFEDIDLSAMCTGATARYISSTVVLNTKIKFNRCKLPSGSGFSVFSGSPAAKTDFHSTIKLHHCSAGNNTYDFHEWNWFGEVSDEIVIVRTGGASDGTTPIAFKMVSSTGCSEPNLSLQSPEIAGWTDETSSTTFTIEGIWDSAANIQDDEIWMEFHYPANATDGLGVMVTDKVAVNGTPADQAASTETWTTTDLTNPNKFKLSVTVTPGKAGPIKAIVHLAKASTTVYIDPLITES